MDERVFKKEGSEIMENDLPGITGKVITIVITKPWVADNGKEPMSMRYVGGIDPIDGSGEVVITKK